MSARQRQFAQGSIVWDKRHEVGCIRIAEDDNEMVVSSTRGFLLLLQISDTAWATEGFTY